MRILLRHQVEARRVAEHMCLNPPVAGEASSLLAQRKGRGPWLSDFRERTMKRKPQPTIPGVFAAILLCPTLSCSLLVSHEKDLVIWDDGGGNKREMHTERTKVALELDGNSIRKVSDRGGTK